MKTRQNQLKELENSYISKGAKAYELAIRAYKLSILTHDIERGYRAYELSEALVQKSRNLFMRAYHLSN